MWDTIKVNASLVAAALAVLGCAGCAIVRKQKRSAHNRRRRSGYPGLIGNTPLIRLNSLSEALGCEILAKVEYLNPGGTGKDRIASRMISEAERRGELKEGGTVVEGTSGSTGISLAALCCSKGYKCIIVMPDDQAQEKVDLLQLFGAQVVKVKTASIVNPQHYVNVARKIASETERAVFMDQFETDANFLAHWDNTGPEIWQQTEGKVQAFVMGAGTGGTLAGVSNYLKQRNPSVRVFLVDPPGSSLYHRVEHGVCYSPHQAERSLRKHRYDTIAEGIGLDRVTANFAKAKIDRALQVTDQEALNMAHFLLHREGLFVGCSSAMNCVGVVRAARELGPGHTIATVLCDHGSRYMSRFWSRDYVERECGLQWPQPNQLEAIGLEALALKGTLC